MKRNIEFLTTQKHLFSVTNNFFLALIFKCPSNKLVTELFFATLKMKKDLL